MSLLITEGKGESNAIAVGGDVCNGLPSPPLPTALRQTGQPLAQ